MSEENQDPLSFEPVHKKIKIKKIIKIRKSDLKQFKMINPADLDLNMINHLEQNYAIDSIKQSESEIPEIITSKTNFSNGSQQHEKTVHNLLNENFITSSKTPCELPAVASDNATSSGIPLHNSCYSTLENRIKILENQNRKIIKQNEEIKTLLLEIREDLIDKKTVTNHQLHKTLLQPLFGYPLKTVDQFKTLDSDGAISERTRLLKYLVTLGASRLREFLYIALGHILTDELLATKFSWNGSHGTESIGNSKVVDTIYLAARQCSSFQGPDTKDHFKNEMLEVLRITKQRLKHKNKYKRKATTVNNESTSENVSTEDKETNLSIKIEQFLEEVNVEEEAMITEDDNTFA